METSDREGGGAASSNARRSFRVLSVIAPGPTGGAETVVRSLSSAQSAAGHRVVVAACWCRGEERPPLVDELRSDGVEVREIVVPHRRYLSELDRLRQMLRSITPEVVHTHGYRSDVLGGAAARLEGLPSISTVHGFTGGGLKNRLFERLQAAAYRVFERVVAVSDPLAATLRERGVPDGKIVVLPNAWSRDVDCLPCGEARRELNLPRGETVLGWVGRVSEEKGLDVAVRALSRVEGVHLAVIGDGPRTAAVKRLGRELGVAERVHWCGRVPDAARLFSVFDLYVLSSRTEGTPMAVFEAMAAGVPVVAAQVGGVPEQIDEATGYPVAPEDPGGLARAVRRAIEDPADARSRASRARSRLRDRFGRDAWVQAYSDVYREAIERRRG